MVDENDGVDGAGVIANVAEIERDRQIARDLERDWQIAMDLELAELIFFEMSDSPKKRPVRRRNW